MELLDRKGVDPTTIDNDRRAWSSFFSWCVEKGYCLANPATKQGRRRSGGDDDDDEVVVLSIAEVRRLLSSAQAYKSGKLVPYVALGLFCGIRPDELKRLRWSDIDVKAKEVTIRKSVSKVKRVRVVSISDNAMEWLLPHAVEKTPIVAKNWRKDFDAVKAHAGFGNPEFQMNLPVPRNDEEREQRKQMKPWPQDCMRHTAISFYLRKHGDEGKAATWAGNSVKMIHDYYLNMVTPEDTEIFWGVTPETVSAQIIPLPQAAVV
jgi:integrase